MPKVSEKFSAVTRKRRAGDCETRVLIEPKMTVGIDIVITKIEEDRMFRGTQGDGKNRRKPIFWRTAAKHSPDNPTQELTN